jgi:hypothetical protein
MIIYSISAISHDAVAETAASLKVRARAGGWRAGGRSSSAAGWKEGRKEAPPTLIEGALTNCCRQQGESERFNHAIAETYGLIVCGAMLSIY